MRLSTILRRLSPLSSRKKRSYCSSMYCNIALKLFELSMASPKPGVSTTVRRNLTPRSSISTVDASNFTVCFCFSVENVQKWTYNWPMQAHYPLAKTYQWNREWHVPDINRSKIDYWPVWTCPDQIRRRPSMWTRIPSSPTFCAPDSANWRSQRTRVCPNWKTRTKKRANIQCRMSQMS